jgi:hypothetical protein
MGRRVSTRLAETILIAMMGVGSLFLWVGIPAGWLILASSLYSAYPKIYLVALLFCPITMILFGWFLVRLNGMYQGLFPEHDDRERAPGRAAWMRSVGADASMRRPLPVLETFMSISVAVAVIAMLVWFFFFAGSSLPVSP